MDTTIEIEKITPRKIESIVNNPEKAATAVHLSYVTDSEEGISRVKNGKDFSYTLKNKKLRDKNVLRRIKSLVIPPAWENVWICRLENGHLQATGLDVKKRKQYKYHPLWNALRNHTKYYRLLAFGKALPVIREQVEKDLGLPGMPAEKVLALVVSIMERTHIRSGNNFYEKLYGSFGLTTLKDKHVGINGHTVRFSFRGKKGIEHNISLKSKKLAALVKKSKDIPGKELFQYYDETGTRKAIDSGMVNDYIKKLSGGDFTSKDFRTWAGTVHAFITLKEACGFSSAAECKKKVVEALDSVAQHLGNTRAVCKKYYVHPSVIAHYENKSLEKFINGHRASKKANSSLSIEENAVLKLLEKG
ncbi:MAG: DNA topoisomerase IB [Ferruginibacter sp.]